MQKIIIIGATSGIGLHLARLHVGNSNSDELLQSRLLFCDLRRLAIPIVV